MRHAVRLRPTTLVARWRGTPWISGCRRRHLWRGRRTRRGPRRARRGSPARPGRRSPSSMTPAQWSRPMSTGCPGTPSYDARARSPPPCAASTRRATTAAPTSGRSTRDTSAVSCRVGPSAARPARSDAPIPSAQSSARIRDTDIGSSAAARSASAPTTTTTSAQGRSACTDRSSHEVPSSSRARAFGPPNRSPAPAARSSPTTEVTRRRPRRRAPRARETSRR